MEKDINPGYVSQIQKYPLLSAHEEAGLSDRISAGDKEALDRLINCNLRLVVSVSHKFANPGISMMDLIQEGNIGLMTAAKKFSREFNTRFSTYAYPWIAQYMLRYINTRIPLISIPHRKDDMIRKIQRAQSTLFQRSGHEASCREIARYLNMDEEKVRGYMTYDYTVASLDTETGEGENSLTAADFLADFSFAPEDMLLKEEERQGVRDMIRRLPRNEQKVIWYRYNFDGEMKSKTLREVSKIIGVSPEAVRQTEIRAIRHMRDSSLSLAM
ncbi:MAG: RNA polymerase sigma factor RpoD/SigA [Treponema sp.]|nr:RNA polymerase sigma factor RpoD/SigA [Treponema sp.]